MRGKEHMNALRKDNKNSPLVKHINEKHESEKDKVEFSMKITGKFNNPLSRQVDESLRIKNAKPNSLMNSKSEFHGPCIRRKVYEK